MIEQISNLHKLVFGAKGWGADEILSLRKSGAEVIASDNAMIIYRAAADEAEILTLAVHPIARRSGLASALIGLMEKDLREKGIKNIFLEVSVKNAPAIGLYAAAGFNETGRRPGYYDGVDAIIMSKNI